MYCVVWGCANNNPATADPCVHYYVFPKHPMVAQQWIEASGWSPEQIDVNIARMCSVHFDDDSYTSELKIVGFQQDNYTRILKYDAVPTLYLPSTTQIVVDGADSQELRDMIVFAVPEQSNGKDYIELQVQNIQTDEKYKHVQSEQQLETVLNCNKTIKDNISKLEQSVKRLREKFTKQIDVYRKNDLELSNLHLEYLRLKRSFLPLNEQKMLLAKVFSESQIKILSGKKKIYWSNDDMAVGYTIRHLSNKRCYLYLTKRLNIPLPAVSSIKRWMTLKSGVSKNSLAIVKQKEEEESE